MQTRQATGDDQNQIPAPRDATVCVLLLVRRHQQHVEPSPTRQQQQNTAWAGPCEMRDVAGPRGGGWDFFLGGEGEGSDLIRHPCLGWLGRAGQGTRSVEAKDRGPTAKGPQGTTPSQAGQNERTAADEGRARSGTVRQGPGRPLSLQPILAAVQPPAAIRRIGPREALARVGCCVYLREWEGREREGTLRGWLGAGKWRGEGPEGKHLKAPEGRQQQ